ncbi:30S ribosomal protein S1 [bacterium]|nr:30S ribosomal protein S1 [bacterium]
MADLEKPEKNGMTDTENPETPVKGGDTDQAVPEKESPKDKKTEKAQPVPVEDLELEESEYSETEFQRFAELYDRTLSDIKEGEIVLGRILAVNNQDVMIDIGFKSEGSVPLEEFGGIENVKIGEEVEVFLDTLEDGDGQLGLSKRKANFIRLWDRVVDVYEQDGVIEGTCVRRIKGGMVVDLMGVDAFLPGSQIDVKPIRDFDSLIGKTFTFKVVKVNRLRKNIVVSRRVLLEESMAEQRGKVLENLEKGQILEGTVKNITDFGVFVDLGGVDGLLHINDLSWGRINHPSSVVKLDQEIKVVVLDFNDAKDRISLGYKQLQPHPWESIEEKYPEGAVVEGKVVSIADYGAFVELERGVEGLVHVSEMSWIHHGIHPSKIVNVGDIIDVKVLNVDKERKRISLGIKQLTPDPWEDIDTRYPIGSTIKGIVRNMTNFGAFVEMEEGIDGLVHISDLSWTKKVKHPTEILKKGEEIEVVVLEINKEDRRISLGLKQLSEDPWPSYEDTLKEGTIVHPKISRFVDKGIIVELEDQLEGFVPLSQMPDSAKEKSALKEGDELELVILEFDRENKRIVLSHKKVADGKAGKEKAGEEADMKKYMKEETPAPTLGEIAGLSDDGGEGTAEAADDEPAEEK